VSIGCGLPLQQCCAVALAIALSTSLAAAPRDTAEGSAFETPEWVGEARASAGQLAARLIPTLQTAMQEGGPNHAIRVCSTEAPEIAAAVSHDNLRIGRTALRVRNPANAADAWEESVLEDFQRRMADGADPATLEAWQVQTLGDRRIGRWMKAIPTAPMCTTCHGTDIDPDLAATIRDHYPEDRASGFEAGDLRGAFTATVEISDR
jgi:hypothetical protein